MFYKCHLASIVNFFRTGLEVKSNKTIGLHRRENVRGLCSLSMWKYLLHLVCDNSWRQAIMPVYLSLCIKGKWWRFLSSALLLLALAEAASRFIQLNSPHLFYTASFCQYKHRSRLKCFTNEAKDKRGQLVPRGRVRASGSDRRRNFLFVSQRLLLWRPVLLQWGCGMDWLTYMQYFCY